MFADVESKLLSASAAAVRESKAFEQLLSFRIFLQKSLDSANKIPCNLQLYTDNDDTKSAISTTSSSIENVLSELTSLLDSQVESNLSKKRKIQELSSSEDTWNQIMDTQQALRPFWMETVNKWHARLHFGSEQAKQKMKTFNKTVWQQAGELLEDTIRVREKSRLPLVDSERLDKPGECDLIHEGESENNEDEDDLPTEDKNKPMFYDEEVYDDRGFYSMILKTYIANASGGEGSSMMRKEDLDALRSHKRKKANVDRKASKGRKIRYTVHPKLQNFMFAVPPPAPPVDVDRLFQSLFQ